MSSLTRCRELADFVERGRQYVLRLDARAHQDAFARLPLTWGESGDPGVKRAAGRIANRNGRVDLDEGEYQFLRSQNQKAWDPLNLNDERFSALRDIIEDELDTAALTKALEMVREDQLEAVRQLAKARLERELAARRR